MDVVLIKFLKFLEPTSLSCTKDNAKTCFIQALKEFEFSMFAISEKDKSNLVEWVSKELNDLDCYILLLNIPEAIEELKKDINPKFVKFNGIFNDEMNAYREDSNGQIFYDYSYIDKLIDFLISIDLKPYINIGFMPKKLASKSQYILDSNVNTSFPKDIKLWTNLIYSFFNHLIDRYGEQEVFSCIFCCFSVFFRIFAKQINYK
jgi:hypothetical protein